MRCRFMKTFPISHNEGIDDFTTQHALPPEEAFATSCIDCFLQPGRHHQAMTTCAVHLSPSRSQSARLVRTHESWPSFSGFLQNELPPCQSCLIDNKRTLACGLFIIDQKSREVIVQKQDVRSTDESNQTLGRFVVSLGAHQEINSQVFAALSRKRDGTAGSFCCGVVDG
jgi:hypothetical protein